MADENRTLRDLVIERMLELGIVTEVMYGLVHSCIRECLPVQARLPENVMTYVW
jgi:hypothetical protein